MSVPPDVVFLEGDGSGRFQSALVIRVPDTASMSAADYDQDGDLDLYCCGYKVPGDEGMAMPVPYHDANNGLPNTLLRNDSAGGSWSFTDVTLEAGLDVNNRRFSFASAWEDYDEDGDLDLYVANDYGRNNLYRNEGTGFIDVADRAGVEDISAGMGVTWADFDRDGRVDLYVSNMFSSAGGRIAYQRQFQDDATTETRSYFQRHARGNSLFRNVGDGSFRDLSVEAGVTMGRWAWGSKSLDINNDGWQDLFVPNGLTTSDSSHDL